MGIMIGEIIIRPTVSATTRSVDPMIHEVGSKNLWSPPIKNLVTWGATMPTNPITPVKQIMHAVINEERMSRSVLVRAVLIPKLLAVSSPTKNMAFKSQENRIKMGEQRSNVVATTNISCQVVPVRVPKVQCTMAISCSSDAKNCSVAVRALKKYIKAIPASTRVSGEAPLNLASPKTMNAHINAKMKAFVIIRNVPVPANPIPNIIASEAPKAAAEEIPTVKGLTRGFRVMPCMATPDMASPAPASTPIITRGSRKSQTIDSLKGLLLTNGKNLAAIAMKTSFTLRSAAPTEAASITTHASITRLKITDNIFSKRKWSTFALF